MGNQPSRSNTPTSSPHSPSVTSSHGHPPNARRRESIQALSTKASIAPPSASLESAAALNSSAHPHTHARARSQTIASSTTAQVASTLRAAHDTMGAEQSRQKGPVAPIREATPPKPIAAPPSLDQRRPAPSPKTRPVDVPSAPRDDALASRTAQASSIEPADASQEGYIVPSSHFSRPPRLPLPIEEEPHTPGSPIISPADLTGPIDHGEIEGPLPRRSSMLSSTAADDDDLGDEFKGPQGQPTVPTLIEWEGPGERVYVTGTFAGWNRKYRLHRNGPSKKKDALSAYVHITPGTHHLMFIVDNDMRTSDKLPTAVDYTNILVNYLEVSHDDIPKPETEIADEARKPGLAPEQQLHPPPGVYPPQVLPPTPELQPVKKPVPEPPKPKAPTPPPQDYHQNIPRYLLDFDAPEESRRFARANAASANLPTPPTLPMFLSKSILNGTTPMKDDSSVLIMPNHTVLNHLATSSIKDNILATSATTRYKQKFLTTIMYKPKNEDPDREY